MNPSVILHNLCSISPCNRNRNLALTHSRFLSSESISKLKKQTVLSNNHVMVARTQKSRSHLVFAAQSNFLKVLQTAWSVGKDGVEAGTNLVPFCNRTKITFARLVVLVLFLFSSWRCCSQDVVPRPIARISVTFLALSISLFVLKSFLSTAFFVLATMGLVYFLFIALNKDQGPGGGGGTTSSTTSVEEDPVEEARKIMEKYK
ncbi:Transmembrane protein [Quillaja saponaria]|uniref:Transmembrane protein n=1 Tax=Quillaja saponaria TaxID=32244 RepID=A0AAD7PMQ3_QUISA|nr:Transmembrane protein [Quillaja saponaria]